MNWCAAAPLLKYLLLGTVNLVEKRGLELLQRLHDDNMKKIMNRPKLN
jgi:hypothetical protein